MSRTFPGWPAQRFETGLSREQRWERKGRGKEAQPVLSLMNPHPLPASYCPPSPHPRPAWAQGLPEQPGPDPHQPHPHPAWAPSTGSRM